MVKKVTTINIDEYVLKQAKKELPNLSLFVEDCLKCYLGIGVEDKFIDNIQENLNIIKQAQLNIHLLSQNDFKQNQVQEFDNKKMDNAWLKIWGVYRNTETINIGTLMEAEKVLGNTFDLKDMMESLLLYLPKSELSKCDNWNYAVREYENILNGVSKYV